MSQRTTPDEIGHSSHFFSLRNQDGSNYLLAGREEPTSASSQKIGYRSLWYCSRM